MTVRNILEIEHSRLKASRIQNKWPVAREGLPFILFGAGLTVLFALSGLFWAVVILGVLTLFTVYFFRDPDRSPSARDDAILSPADGTVIKVESSGKNDSPLGIPSQRVSIFMSVFNVHVNRVPASGSIVATDYRAGKFFSANLDKASEHNERNSVIFETHTAKRILVVQIAGLIARRIACWVDPGDTVTAGQRFGLIRFGSRLDVHLPAEARIVVARHQKVKAGVTIIAYLK